MGTAGFFCPRGALCFPPGGPQSVEKSARCGFLLARLSSSQCQPAALGSADLACLPARFGRTAARGRTAPGKLPHRKIPGTRSGMPGIFLLRSDGDHTGEPLPISTSAATEGGKLSPMRAFAGRRRSAHRPAHPRRTAARTHRAGQTAPIRKSPALTLECRGFLSIYSCCTGGHFSS